MEYSDELSLTVLTRLTTNNLLSLLLPLPSTRPWLRRFDDHWHVFAQGAWQRLDSNAPPGPQGPDVQLWLALHHLLLDPIARSKLGLDRPSVLDRVLHLRRHLTEATLTKVPPLRQLQRVLEELALGGVPSPAASLVVEHTSTLWDGLHGTDWATVARQQLQGHLDEGVAGARQARQVQAMAEQLDALCGVVDAQQAPVCLRASQQHAPPLLFVVWTHTPIVPLGIAACGWPGTSRRARHPSPSRLRGGVPRPSPRGWVGALGVLPPAGRPCSPRGGHARARCKHRACMASA